MSCLYIAEWAYTNSNQHLPKLFDNLFNIDSLRPYANTYELFHANWEAIRCYSFVQSHIYLKKSFEFRILLDVREIYNGLGQVGNINSHSLYIEKTVDVSNEYGNIEELLNAELTKDGKLKNTCTLRKIFCFGGNSPGCDSLCFHETQEGDLAVRALRATQQICDIKESYDYVHRAFNQYPCLKDRIYFVVQSWQQPTHHHHAYIPDNTIILTKNHLFELYSSLNQRLQLSDPTKLSSNKNNE